MTLLKSLKNILRPPRDVAYAFSGYMYDFLRFFKYAGWKGQGRESVRDYKAVKIYHRLEKSLSFRHRKSLSGRGAATDLIDHLSKTEVAGDAFTFHEKVGLKVLQDFVDITTAEGGQQIESLSAYCRAHKNAPSDVGGVIDTNAKTLQNGRLQDPEKFFSSRFSVRDFDDQRVPHRDIDRALELALKTPSVCNRQASFVYRIHSREGIAKALSLQNGNRGFGHEVPCLLILCADISAFDTAGERNQQWVDGGMFSMTLVWALHSLGYASCCLNWSKGPKDDIKLRKLVPIENRHTVLMMLAVGLPKEELKVCYSARKPIKLFYKDLK